MNKTLQVILKKHEKRIFFLCITVWNTHALCVKYCYMYVCYCRRGLDYWIYWSLTGRATNNYNIINFARFYSSLLHTLVS
jgi:hypothetical protein